MPMRGCGRDWVKPGETVRGDQGDFHGTFSEACPWCWDKLGETEGDRVRWELFGEGSRPMATCGPVNVDANGAPV